MKRRTLVRKNASAKKSRPKKRLLGGSAASASSAGKGKKRDINSVISDLDVSSLHKADVADVLLHCASALHVRTAIDTPGPSPMRSAGNYCYTKSGSSSRVSIWNNGFKVYETSEDDALAQGIRPCG